jgi:hypothetical protein
MAAAMRTFASRRLTLSVATVVIATALILAWEIGRIALRPTPVYSGAFLLALVLGLTFFNARKKLPFLPLLTAHTWLQAHIYLGWLTVIVFVLHTGGRVPDGRLEILLSLCFYGVAVSGAFGLWISRRLPSRMVRSGESLVFERIPALRHRLHEDVMELVRKAEVETKSTTLGDFYVRELNRYFDYVPRLFGPLLGDDIVHHGVSRELTVLRRYLDKRETEFADQLAALVETKRNLDFQFASQRLLKLWLFVHIPLTYGLLVLAAAHVWLALHYTGRL